MANGNGIINFVSQKNQKHVDYVTLTWDFFEQEKSTIAHFIFTQMQTKMKER